MTSMGTQQTKAAVQWPNLAALLSAAAHGDDDRSPMLDLADAISSLPRRKRRQIADEWGKWNRHAGASGDLRLAVEELDSGVLFYSEELARAYMDEIFAGLLALDKPKDGGRVQ